MDLTSSCILQNTVRNTGVCPNADTSALELNMLPLGVLIIGSSTNGGVMITTRLLVNRCSWCISPVIAQLLPEGIISQPDLVYSPFMWTVPPNTASFCKQLNIPTSEPVFFEAHKTRLVLHQQAPQCTVTQWLLPAIFLNHSGWNPQALVRSGASERQRRAKGRRTPDLHAK